MSGRIDPVAVTAWQCLSAAGSGPAALHAAIRGNQPCLTPMRLFPLPFETVVGEYVDSLPTIRSEMAAYACRNARLALAALNREDFRDRVAAALDRYGAGRVGLILGTSTSGIYDSEEAYAHFVAHGTMPADFNFLRRHAIQATAEFLGLELGLQGPVYAVSTACSSSAKAMGAGQRLLQTGICDAVLVAGVDTLCRLTLRGFHSLDLIAAGLCRPMDADREGINIGEAAALLLLERSGADNQSCPHLLAVGESSDAHHMSAPDPEGRGAEAAMRAALALAGLEPESVGYVNLHATATALNDLSEARAVARLFGRQVPGSGVKGLLGHTLGASGALESIVTFAALRNGRLPGTTGLRRPDPECPIHLLEGPASTDTVVALCNAFGFGGSNASVLLARSGEDLPGRGFRWSEGGGDAREGLRAPPPLPSPQWGEGWVGGSPPGTDSRRPSRPSPPPSLAYADGKEEESPKQDEESIALTGWAVCTAEPELSESMGIAADPLDPKRIPAAIRRRTSQATRLALCAASLACERAGIDPAQLPAVFASVGGEMQVTDRLCIELAKPDGWVSPTQFHNSVHNTAAGYWSIATGCRRASTALGGAEATVAAAWLDAWSRLRTETDRILIVCYDEHWPDYLEPGMGMHPVALAWVLDRSGDGVFRVSESRPDSTAVLPEALVRRISEAPVLVGVPLIAMLGSVDIHGESRGEPSGTVRGRDAAIRAYTEVFTACPGGFSPAPDSNRRSSQQKSRFRYHHVPLGVGWSVRLSRS
ncbi:beta-ketoacyl-ACP synthase [Methylohalobius crimeensis]|uniref:beta-ketoacyl-ACP synthase n=1 Tax=Methylohalobius crimeensis TaxID=244365 RepID=UPI0003B7564B|nr:beta-ketoacyl-ACP synthase [Methylohalobius crimeensis]